MSGCGSCTLCCRLMAIPEIEKSADKWCTHCDKGKGCKIYEVRPEPCKGWSCLWLLSQTDENGDIEPMAEEMRPDRSKVIFDVGSGQYEHVLTLHVDPGRPDAWEKPEVQQMIHRWLTDDQARVVVITGNKRRMFMRQR
jgi:hypothetical protein